MMTVIITMWLVCLSVTMAVHFASYMPVLSSISTSLLLQSIPFAGSEAASSSSSSSSSSVSEVLLTRHHGASTIDDASVPCNDLVLS